MIEVVRYFGYGANRDPKMIAAITGKKVSELSGQPGVLLDFDIAVQALDQVPDVVAEDSPVPKSPREMVKKNWPESFTSYVIQHAIGGRVAGTIWELTPDDRERVRDWELIDFGWYQDTVGVAEAADGTRVDIVTEQLGPGQQVSYAVDGMNYSTWLNSVEDFEAIAAIARQEYDERQ
jgi:hypothetical protein